MACVKKFNAAGIRSMGARTKKGTLCSTLFVALSLLSPSLAAEPPSVEIPAGSCVGVGKRSPVTSHPAEQDFDGDLSGATLYFDFDNLEWYLTVFVERVFNGEEQTGTVVMANGLPFTIKVSETTPYALEATTPYINFDGEEEITQWMLMPANGGQSFLLVNNDTSGVPYYGVCQTR